MREGYRVCVPFLTSKKDGLMGERGENQIIAMLERFAHGEYADMQGQSL